MKLFLRRRVNNINFFFCFLTNTIFLKKQNTWARYSMMQSVFVANTFTGQCPDLFLFKFFKNSEGFWNLFWRIVSFNRDINSGFFAELELIGLGFRIKKITNTLYRFFWGHSNYVYLFVPASILMEYSQDERLVFFFGIDATAINRVVSYLLLLKKLSVYRVTGFVRPGRIIRLNSGKQR